MAEETDSKTRQRGVLNVGVTRYHEPLGSTDAKKLARLNRLVELHVVGFADGVRYARPHEPVELYLVPLLPLAGVRFAVLVVFAVGLGLRLARKRRLDIVLSQSPYEGIVGVLVRAVAARFGRRIAVVTEVHGDWSESPFLYRRIPFAPLARSILAAWASFVLRRSDAVRTVSTFLESKVGEVAPDVPVRRFPAYTDFELFAGAPRERADDGSLVAVGGLYPVKGFSHLVRAMQSVVRERPGAVVEIVGDGPLRGELEALARDLGVAENVRFAGTLSQAELASRYRRARLMVLPSLSEGLGRVVWEAMASGLPVVASNVGGIPELVVDRETGLLVPPGNDAALAEAISFVLSHPDEAGAMGAAGRDAVHGTFTTERYAEGYRELFDLVS